MPENSPTTQDEAGVTRTPTGTIQDQGTSIPPTSPPPATDKPPSTAPSSETPKTEAKSDAPRRSLINEESEEPKGAPEKYEDFTLPEGYTLDAEVATEAGALFKKHGLNQSAAQELVDFYVKQTKDAFMAPFNKFEDMRQEWRDAVNADPEIGGSKLRSTRASIGRLIDSFGNSKVAEGFRKAMDDTGAGDHPDVVRGLVALAKHLTEGSAVRGNGPSTLGQQVNGQAQPSTAQAIYPHLPSTRG